MAFIKKPHLMQESSVHRGNTTHRIERSMVDQRHQKQQQDRRLLNVLLIVLPALIVAFAAMGITPAQAQFDCGELCVDDVMCIVSYSNKSLPAAKVYILCGIYTQ